MKNNEKNFIGDINKELEEIEKLDILEEIEESQPYLQHSYVH